MSMRLSRLYGMDIFSDNGKYLGKVYDIIIDIEKGDVARLTLEAISAASREEAQRIIREKTVLYKNVKSVEDVVVVSKIAPTAGYAYSPTTKEEETGLSFLK